MVQPDSLPASKDKTLFTPGPLTTSLTVKQAMLHDAGSWHFEFNAVVRNVRDKILALAGLSRADGFECVLLQGSGTFGVESVLASCIPPEGKLLVVANGAYGVRITLMATSRAFSNFKARSPFSAPSPEQRRSSTRTFQPSTLRVV